MQKLITEKKEQVCYITLNNPAKHNAFDDQLLIELDHALDSALTDDQIQILVLQAQGKHFSAGADLAWMQRMANMNEQENQADALRFAKTLFKLAQSPKPTMALVQGATYGGGIGLIAACDIVFAAETAQFCFSEVKLGLIPAVISPYIIQAIGARAAKALFLSAEVFHAQYAKDIHLIQHIVNQDELHTLGHAHAQKLSQMPHQALRQAKALVQHVQTHPLDAKMLQDTAQWIAQIRVSKEAQNALHLFLNRSAG